MKISVDGQDLFELSEIQKKVICNDIHEEIFDEDMKRRLLYILMDKYENCFKRLKAEWDVKLAEAGLKSLPIDKDEYASLVFEQKSYQCRKTRDSAADVVI